LTALFVTVKCVSEARVVFETVIVAFVLENGAWRQIENAFQCVFDARCHSLVVACAIPN